MIGLADDEGVRLNGGRPGAADGPRAFRAALARYGAVEPASIAWPTVFDAGDVQPGDSIEQTHGRVTEAVAAALDLGMVPIGIGGGHDLTFPFVRAVAERFGAMSGVYLDAHLDVREEVGSGMPFRRILETGLASSLAVHGLDRFATRADHLSWFEANGGVFIDEAGPPAWPDGPCFLSIDLDVLDQSVAPGVSATNPAGWSAGRACAWARSAGRNPDVRCIDIMELCPRHDEAGSTARVAARLCLEFLAGFAERVSANGA
ncbi:MAG: formimidoylglutamase [Planctomycetota bacterium]